ncbi:RhoGAP domain-containing protein [Reticulomyxa filosa]|uniref:RhoGAP domain-containing protein n=1 Tax=Reticulomyxa filosa TaxID=46433 RepID=X6MYZ6_RETFI|nr:RhoGAP domain-containing protein [Reticulomyxa filosa]|eukprot:ETO19031.1 RhoGAP domain-containing protein [Reticulomyxa filosa]
MAKDKQKLDHETLEENRESIRYLVSFLKKLLKPECVEVTKMNLENVAIVFAPTILMCPNDDPTLLMQNSKFEKDFVIQMITNLRV